MAWYPQTEVEGVLVSPHYRPTPEAPELQPCPGFQMIYLPFFLINSPLCISQVQRVSVTYN